MHKLNIEQKQEEYLQNQKKQKKINVDTKVINKKLMQRKG